MPVPATDRVQRSSSRPRWIHTAVYVTTSALLLTGWWLALGGEGAPSPLARALGAPDTRVHVWFGWALLGAMLLPLVIWRRGLARFARETFRVDRGDLHWWRRWPSGTLTGRFAPHRGHFDPGQRVANVVLVAGLGLLVVTGIAMSILHGGHTFAIAARLHLVAAFVVTPVIAGHVLIGVGVLPGYRGVWRAVHRGGWVPIDTARRLWPAWTDRSIHDAKAGSRPTPSPTPGGGDQHRSCPPVG